jgi:hypothetical protein
MAASATGVCSANLALVDGDLALAAGTADAQGDEFRDLAPICGRDATDLAQKTLAQALQVIVGTPFGSDPVNVNYGLDIAAIFAVANNVRAIKDVIRLNLFKSLSADDRVREINDIVFDDEPGFAQLAPELAGGDAAAQAQHTRQWHAIVALTMVGGSQQQVALTGASP